MSENFSTFTSSASATRPVDAAGKLPNSCAALLITETGGAVARVKFMSSCLAKPATACVGAENVAAGAITVGNHIFKVSYITAQGETEPSAVSNTVAAAGVRQIDLTAIPVLVGDGAELVTGRNVYMTEAGGATYYKVDAGAATVATIADNTTTTLTVNLSDATLAGYVAAPSLNTSGIERADIRLAASQTFYMAFPDGAVSAYLPRCEITTGAATTKLYGK